MDTKNDLNASQQGNKKYADGHEVVHNYELSNAEYASILGALHNMMSDEPKSSLLYRWYSVLFEKLGRMNPHYQEDFNTYGRPCGSIDKAQQLLTKGYPNV